MKLYLTILLLAYSFLSIAQERDTTVLSGKDSIRESVLGEVIVTASRIPEKLLLSPVTVEKVSRSFFLTNSSPSFFDALDQVKGVQTITPSMGFKIINTRGFANTTNVRFAQLVDGMDIQSPHIGSPIGNVLGPGDLDIERVEIIPGVASAMYGMNSINGLANFYSRDPFLSEGLSIRQHTALTHLNNTSSAPRIFSETQLRWVKKLNEQWAVKFNLGYMHGYDWVADNYNDLSPQANASTGLTGDNNPALNPVNSYGNEATNRRTLNLGGRAYQVARTGYREIDVTDYTLQNIKGDAGIFYKTKKGHRFSYNFRYAFLNNIYQRANRFRLEDYALYQHGINYQSPSIQAKLYYNGENTGDSYNLRSMAENMDRAGLSDNEWFALYNQGYTTALQSGQSVEAAHQQARQLADRDRLQPGTAGFNETISRLQQINNWDSGAALKVRAGFIHGEVQFNLTEQWLKKWKEKAGLELLAGLDHRTYLVQPDGNYFINPEAGKAGRTIRYGRTGAFVSVYKQLLQDKLRLGVAVRADKNDYFNVKWNPRVTAVYSINSNQSLRLSFTSSYRFPIVFEAYSNVNSGGVKRVGGLPVMSNGIFENAWLQTSIASYQAAILRDVNQGGLSRQDAIEKNKGLLQKNPYTYLEPEQVRSVEIGYRGVFLSGRLYVDGGAYFNRYNSFIAQANMNIPRTKNPDSLAFYLADNRLQEQYRMWTNSSTTIDNIGFHAGGSFRLVKDYVINANTSFQQLLKTSNEDGLEDGFNTPEWMVNAGIANKDIHQGIGAGINLRWQSRYYWESFLVNGDVPSITTLDANISYQFTKMPLQLKLGGNNLFNRYYYSILGGPSIGGYYYLTVTWGLPKK
ncbi:TonB-dependent receptor [Flavihumibacter cheonanensis]|uniref:TonB-dependent receptor n=1 Tax=Flavihumibacter cheonanensis TaxID=1442385 RepID=UPI001EF7939D|nr:TonB-dependent receptor [Flavihumibacter cheonanensis]MCG7753982.1 TonB-dependent receptor [Flavihumibacter cheonanensis]